MGSWIRTNEPHISKICNLPLIYTHIIYISDLFNYTPSYKVCQGPISDLFNYVTNPIKVKGKMLHRLAPSDLYFNNRHAFDFFNYTAPIESCRECFSFKQTSASVYFTNCSSLKLYLQREGRTPNAWATSIPFSDSH
jgi:hypothetical protein